ncbi:MAG: outer membrane lipoprotein carrier protein LolA [Bacteroidetes bacterium]|nr:outer membrane lipoprotein carrier protein LolA [Bacteroidota bacterium]
MKRLLTISLILTTSVQISLAQKDAQARKIMNTVGLKYKAYNLIKAGFTFKLDDPQANIRNTQTGTLIARPKENKFKVIIYDPANKLAEAQEIISDGKSQWTYVKKDNEVELNDVDKSEGNINPAQIFTFYERGYKYIYNGDYNIGGRVCQEIDLTPEDPKKPFFKIRLEIDKVKKQIYSAMIFDKNGSRYTYTIDSFTPNAKLPETIFTYDKKDHPGVEVVDLR